VYPCSNDALGLEAVALMQYTRNPNRPYTQRLRRAEGFTLIELIITVMIASILVSLAVSSYSRYIDRSRRVEAQSRLYEIAMQLEREFTRTGSYPLTLPATVDLSIPAGATAATRRYLVTYATANNGYTLTSTPQNQQLNDVCGTMSLNDANVRSSSTAHQTVAECWRR
jgi:type IV pilus assembly protein PilE